jgi:hypothetical protein
MIIDPIADPTAYPLAADILDTLSDLAANNPDICKLDTTSVQSANGKPIGVLQIASGSPAVVVYVTGGVHAREWAPPLALTRFCQKLVQAAGPAGNRAAQVVRYAPFVRPAAPAQPADPPYEPLPARPMAQFPQAIVDQPAVKEILSLLDIRIVPLVNVDGYDWSRTQAGQKMWRKNLHNYNLPPCPPFEGLDFSVGVDLNRNSDAVWDVDKYYSATYYKSGAVKTAKDPCGTPVANKGMIFGEEYRGPQQMSEPEVAKLLDLIDKASPVYYVDVHSYGPNILFGWPSSLVQTKDDTQNFQNKNHDGKRDATYGEFLTADRLRRLQAIADRMADGIRSMRTADVAAAVGDVTLRSEYSVMESAALYPHTGTLPGHVMTQNYGTAQPPDYHIPVVDPVHYPYTIECGTQEARFHPQIAIDYIKIEREIHLALWALLSVASSPFQEGVKLPIHT